MNDLTVIIEVKGDTKNKYKMHIKHDFHDLAKLLEKAIEEVGLKAAIEYTED